MAHDISPMASGSDEAPWLMIYHPWLQVRMKPRVRFWVRVGPIMVRVGDMANTELGNGDPSWSSCLVILYLEGYA